MKTYAESVNQKPFDWNEELDAIIYNPVGVDSFRADRLADLAADWVTCACGNQCDILPRYPDGSPVDHRLACLGSDFYQHIRGGNWNAAKRTLKLIEERALGLINEMKDNPITVETNK